MTEPGRRREGCRGQHEADLVEKQQDAAVHPVGDRPAEQRGRHERHDLDRAEQAYEQRRVGLDVHLVGQRDQRRLRAQSRDEPAEHDQPQVAAVPERGQVWPQAM
jgi:hypothetical protein